MYIVQSLAAGAEHGLRAFQVRLAVLAPGEHGRRSRHTGELVLLATAGTGKLVVDGGPQRFASPCTLLIPPHLCFELVNNGTVPLHLVTVCTQAPTDWPAS